MSYEKNAIIYCRISSKQQQEWWGLNSQEISCRKYCDENGYNVLNVFSDVFTWWDLDRPWLRKLFHFIDECEKKTGEKVSLLIVDDIDRIARDYGVHLEITKELKRRRIEYQSVKMKFENTPAGTFIEWTMALQAQFFRLQNKERVLSRQEARLLDGYRPRFYPLWYKTKSAPAGGRMLIRDEPNATYVAEALELYANNSLNSITEVKDYLKAKGIKTNRSTVWRMLHNILYTGMIEYHETSYEKDGILKKKRNIPLREWRHEGLISMETFKQIQKKLQGKRTYTHEIKVVNDEYPLRGYIVCSCCNLALTSWKSRGKSGKQFPYYQFNRGCKYKWKSISANKLHQTFNDLMEKLTIADYLLVTVKKNIQKEFRTQTQIKKKSRKHIEKELIELEAINNSIIDKIATTTSITVQQWLERKIEDNLVLIDKLNIELRTVKEESDMLSLIDLACRVLWDPYYIWKNWNIQQKQLLLKLVFSKKIPVDFSTGTYWTPTLNRLYLLSGDILESESQDLEICQYLLNPWTMSLSELQDEIKRFHYFGTLLSKSENLPKYHKYLRNV